MYQQLKQDNTLDVAQSHIQPKKKQGNKKNMEYGCWKKIEKGVVALSIRATKCFVFYNFELSHIATIQKY